MSKHKRGAGRKKDDDLKEQLAELGDEEASKLSGGIGVGGPSNFTAAVTLQPLPPPKEKTQGMAQVVPQRPTSYPGDKDSFDGDTHVGRDSAIGGVSGAAVGAGVGAVLGSAVAPVIGTAVGGVVGGVVGGGVGAAAGAIAGDLPNIEKGSKQIVDGEKQALGAFPKMWKGIKSIFGF